MAFKLSAIFVIAQAILLAVAMAPTFNDSTNSTEMTTEAYGCFKQGEFWKDLGTTEDIVAAYDEQWCKIRLGTWVIGTKGNLCVRDHPIAHAFFWEWEVTKVPDGQDGGYVSHDVCICFLAQALKLCEKGGILDLVCGPGTDGGDVIGMYVTADPQGSFSCHG